MSGQGRGDTDLTDDTQVMRSQPGCKLSAVAAALCSGTSRAPEMGGDGGRQILRLHVSPDAKRLINEREIL